MLDRVEMDVVDMTVQIILVLNVVLQIASLPNTALTLEVARQGYRLGWYELAGKRGFDQGPACRVGAIACRQLPDCMQVVWQHYYCQNFERMP
ncbi:hypothetical protein D9M68_912200 [compost metagenome]